MSKSSDKSDKLSIKLTKTQHEEWIELRKVLAKKTDKDLYLYLVDFYVTFKDKVVADAMRPVTKPPPPLRPPLRDDFIDEFSSSDDDGGDSAMYLLSAVAYKKTLIRNEDTAQSAETFRDDDVVKPREAMTLIQLPSAMMDEPDSMSALNTTSLNNDDVKTKSSEPSLLNSIKREEATYEARESTNFEDNLSKCGMNSLNELFVTKKDVIKIEEDEDSGGGGGEFDDEEDLMEELFGEEEESMEEDDDDDDEYVPPSPALNGLLCLCSVVIAVFRRKKTAITILTLPSFVSIMSPSCCRTFVRVTRAQIFIITR